MARPKPAENNKPEIVGLFGVGLDNKDGHKRITRADEFLLIGGSQATHERMQEVAIHFMESLNARGKRLKDAETDEIADLLRDATER